MNRVYVRGCDAAYLEPLLSSESFSYCTKPATTSGRRLSDNNGLQDTGAVTATMVPSFASVAGVPTSEENQTTSATVDPRTHEGGPVLSARASSRMGRSSDRFSNHGTSDRVRRSPVEPIATHEDGNSNGSSGGVPSLGSPASGVHEAVVDGRRMPTEGENEGEFSAGGGPKVDTKSSQTDGDGDDDPPDNMSSIGKRGRAGSLVIHIRSGDIFKSL